MFGLVLMRSGQPNTLSILRSSMAVSTMFSRHCQKRGYSRRCRSMMALAISGWRSSPRASDGTPIP